MGKIAGGLGFFSEEFQFVTDVRPEGPDRIPHEPKSRGAVVVKRCHCEEC